LVEGITKKGLKSKIWYKNYLKEKTEAKKVF